MVARMQRQNSPARGDEEVEGTPMETVRDNTFVESDVSRREANVNAESDRQSDRRPDLRQEATPTTDHSFHKVSLKLGIPIIVGFFVLFAALMVLRGVFESPPLPLQLFINMVLAGTIIFGGGPVVIPLLREYVVQPGWVPPRDFLIGLAIIQAFPGPNFNFAVYLGALALRGTDYPMILGAILGFIGIFFPGLTLALGFQSLWRVMRSNRFVLSALRGVNAGAVGLVFTAVHRLWEIGYVKPDAAQGVPLGSEPWWVVIAACAYVGVESFGVPTPVGIVSGGVLGLVWYAVLQH